MEKKSSAFHWWFHDEQLCKLKSRSLYLVKAKEPHRLNETKFCTTDLPMQSLMIRWTQIGPS